MATCCMVYIHVIVFCTLDEYATSHTVILIGFLSPFVCGVCVFVYVCVYVYLCLGVFVCSVLLDVTG